jgi:uncharacterized protein YutE (UPF0331/DUF86 family)
MVDAPRVQRLLQRIRDEAVAVGRSVERNDGDILADDDALPALKYRLIVAVEAAVDVAEHVIAAEGLRPSDGFADSFRSLGESGWLPSELADALADAASFRNLLVHQYADVDDGRVLANARNRLGDLDAFVDQIAQRLARS